MKKYNIVTGRKYTGKDGAEKTQWMRVGTLLNFPATADKEEGFVMELNMFPTTKFSVFEEKPTENISAPKSTLTSPGVDGEVIDTDEIPF